MKAKRIVYLIHSMIYSSLAARDPRVLRDTNAGIYLERERLCERRWRAAVRQLEPDALYAQLAGGSEFLAWAREQLGEERVIEPRAEWRDGKEIEVYRRELSDSFLAQLADKGNGLDLETTRLELWGESFTGCVYGYGTALARHLGLKTPPFVDFDMTVPDERHLCKAELVTHFLLPGSPVRGYLFESPLGFPVGLFIEGFGRHDSGAAGRIRIPVDCNKVTVENAAGITLYADLVVDRPNRRIPVEPVRGFEGIAATDEGLEIPRGMPCCILGLRLSPDTLLEAMQNAAVTED